ncbi:MAG TPA: cytochrome c oxidase assembly protein [Chthoniobacterales bacterium]
MEDAADAVIESWSIQLWPTVGLVLLAVIYFRGWLKLRRQVPHRFDGWRLASFLGGVATVFLALDSPLDTFSNLLLQAHMIQHLLLMMIAPPLLLLGNPFLPLLTGLPRPFVREVIRPFLLWNACKRFGRWLTNPKVTWILFVVLTLGWHAPPLYELTLRSPTWHIIEHACFLGSGTLFWWPVVQPWPSRPQWPEWAIIPYLLLADVQNTVLSAFLTFSDRVVYPSYGLVPQFPGMNPLSDQHAAGAIMWVPGSIFYLIPAGILAMRFLSPRRHAAARDELLLSRSRVSGRDALPLIRSWFNTARSKKRSEEREIVPTGRVDLLALGWVGRVIRSLAFRRVVQGILFGLAVLIVCDGLFGPQIGPMNLAGTLPWTHWRGLSVLALLVFGNFFCFACPFTFARDLGRRILPGNRQWPRWLRTKWVSAGLLAIYLWSYEAFSLWNSPWLTAWVIIGYFVAAIVVDGFFRGASFCKYVCPIGQFNFVQSLVSPFEVKTRNLDVCHTCKSFDCIKGNQQQRGCELRLFQPKKESNLDCTFCLDCVRACPHDNIGIIAVTPGRTLARDHFRSSIGRFAERTDLAALVLVLVFGAFLNAASMTLPVENALSFSRLTLDLISRPAVLLIFFFLVLGLLPLIAIAGCALASRWLGSITGTVRSIACRFTMTLVPLGAAMWLAHFGFHLFTALLTPIPVVQRIFLDLHIGSNGSPWWSLHTPAIPQLLDFQCLALDLGLLVSLFFAWKVCVRLAAKRKAVAAFLPWSVLLSLLYVAGIWIVFQPMEMRGMLH